ncbi:hypothetical protein MHU86_18289 [Fragilaria crotonensis]|nr:hypothetical protein MHU86_18289 [Fragilaria crotonensis]
MSIFPFQFLNDFMSSPDNGNDDNDTVLDVESGDESVSGMMSGIHTEPTTDNTFFIGDGNSVATTATTGSLMAPVYGDHGATTGLPAGTFVEIFRQHMTQSQSQSQQTDLSLSAASGVTDFEEHNESFTIVSSAPSGTGTNNDGYLQLHLPVDREPPPLIPDRLWHGDNLSISTTESVYRDLASLQNSNADSNRNNNDSNASLLSLHLTPSMLDSASISVSSHYHADDDKSVNTTQSEKQRRSMARHDSTSFIQVGDRLAQQPVAEEEDCEWFARFTEQDWLAFRQDAQMIMAAIAKEHGTRHDDNDEPYLPLPPMPPNHAVASAIQQPCAESYCAADVLPPSFICAICNDVIVGSTTLDCCCARSAVCMTCWEDHCFSFSSSDDNNNIDDDDNELEDLIRIHHNTTCPSCAKTVVRNVACHALDVAILHCVKGLPDQHPVQTAYYRRLAAWRAQVQRRRLEWKRHQVEEQQTARDALLAELIQEEERFFWNKEKKAKSFWENHQFILLALAEVALLATAAAFGGGGVMRGTLLTRK